MRLTLSRNGLCDTLVSDSASCFTAEQFRDSCKLMVLLISHHRHTARRVMDELNGVRVMKDLKKSDPNDTFKSRLAKCLFYYRSIPHLLTKSPPSVLLNNRKFIPSKIKSILSSVILTTVPNLRKSFNMK